MPYKLHIEGRELFDSNKGEFVTIKPIDLVLEHSLISISKWEAKWHKAFLDDKVEKTRTETLDYFVDMVISPKEVDPNVFLGLTAKQQTDLMNYIKDPMTATTFTIRKKGPKNREIITSELIYYWMCGNQIPFECEKWHLNRLLTLIQVCGIKNDPKSTKKMNKRDIIRDNDSINEARKARLNTKG